jgi:two-component system phosphate regulon sensor histidine kinase PhoR
MRRYPLLLVFGMILALGLVIFTGLDAYFSRPGSGQATRSFVLALFFIVFTAGLFFFALRWLRRLALSLGASEAGDFHLPAARSNLLELDRIAVRINSLAGQVSQGRRVFADLGQERDAILASMQEAVLAIDRSERIVTANQAAAELFEQPFPSMLNRAYVEVVRHAQLQRLIAQALTSEAPLREQVTLYTREKTIQVLAHATPWQGASRERLGSVLVLDDITLLKAAEERQREFVANVSHELRTPITLIQGFVETLQDGAILHPKEAKKFLATIEQNAKRMTAIIEDLMSLAKLESWPGETLATQETNMRELAENVLKNAALATKKKQISLVLSCPEELYIKVNPILMERCLDNLLDNAVKYSPDKTEVRLEIIPANDTLLIKVIDQGYGIAAEHLPRIFERFFRIDKARSRSTGGTGLGLAIVKRIVEAHGGRMRVESRPDQGSTFEIILPASPAAAT